MRTVPDPFFDEVAGVIHVGANAGQERELYAAHGLRVVWVEPNPQVFARLLANIHAHGNQRAIQALVTDVDGGDYAFHISNNNGASSSIFQLKQHKDVWPTVHFTTTLQIKSTTLATLLARERIDVRDYQALVLDTQGSELLVLRGSLPVLGNFRFIKTEVADFESYEGCCQLSDIESFLTEHGYQELSRRPFATRAAGGTYYDIIYERRTEQPTDRVAFRHELEQAVGRSDDAARPRANVVPATASPAGAAAAAVAAAGKATASAAPVSAAEPGITARPW